MQHACDDDQAPPLRAPWDAEFSVGHELIDAQHKNLLSQCDLLAACCLCRNDQEAQQDFAQSFDQAFDRLKVLAREHCETEAALLASHGYPELEEHRFAFDEFDYLASEIATADNFDRQELQRFLTLWCIGHITDSVNQQRDFLGRDPTAA